MCVRNKVSMLCRCVRHSLRNCSVAPQMIVNGYRLVIREFTCSGYYRLSGALLFITGSEGCAMPYNYQYDMATSKATVVFKLLFRWRGSVWRAVYVEYFIWLAAYAILSCIYRFALNTEQQGKFEKFAEFCDKRLSYIPMNFMLGFFVTVVVNRWVTQFANLGMIDNIALFTSQLVKGNDDRGKNLRRNIVRYCVASQCLVFRDIHLGVRRRFPTLETMVAAGFLQKHELDKFLECKSRYAKYWLPFNWALHLLNVALEEKRLDGDIPRNAIAQEIRSFRTGLSLIWTYDWVPLPVMYPQLIFMAVHTYFFVCIFCRQFIITPTAANFTVVDLYFPIMSSLEFIFYVGWMKVAMELLNPFGEDDDDFDCNFLLDRNLTTIWFHLLDAYSEVSSRSETVVSGRPAVDSRFSSMNPRMPAVEYRRSSKLPLLIELYLLLLMR
ncbi:hypothetical protein Y032_0043g807 [Ancylostoma ceylanicum]|uniref:Bestrophin homolog n=1 Tax=Ancylostoma ceylanicum TaxID=53326 RepID=A0A016UFH1_9BILA|nr:hypothetical protein Y032_0043g807 [Ancylostoma ceylanicum]